MPGAEQAVNSAGDSQDRSKTDVARHLAGMMPPTCRPMQDVGHLQMLNIVIAFTYDIRRVQDRTCVCNGRCLRRLTVQKKRGRAAPFALAMRARPVQRSRSDPTRRTPEFPRCGALSLRDSLGADRETGATGSTRTGADTGALRTGAPRTIGAGAEGAGA